MEFCCPSPENPVIPPNRENLRWRKNLRMLFYFKIVGIFIELLSFGSFKAIMELIMLLIIYQMWASMFFCSGIFIMIFSGIDLFVYINYYIQFSSLLTFFYHICFIYLIAFDAASIYIACNAYSVFKRDYMLVHGNYQGLGGGGAPSRPMFPPGGMS